MKKLMAGLLLTGVLAGCGTASQPQKSSQAQQSSQPKRVVQQPSNPPVVQQNTDVQDMANYWNQIKAPYMSLISDVQTVTNLASEDANNPNEVYSQDYRDQVQQACNKMESDISAIEAVPTPNNPKVEAVSNEILQGVEQEKFVADNLPTAVNDVDTDLIEECAQAFNNSSVDFSTATTLEQQINGGN